MRLRVKSETDTPVPSVVPTPETASVVEVEENAADEEDSESTATARKTLSSPSGPQSGGKDVHKIDSEKHEKEKGANFVGKINNLVTTDLQSIVSGRDFTFAFVYTPMTIFVSLYFLYIVLGWRYAFYLSSLFSSLPGITLTPNQCFCWDGRHDHLLTRAGLPDSLAAEHTKESHEEDGCSCGNGHGDDERN